MADENAPSSRGTRERKQVERLAVADAPEPEKELVIPKGKGTKLGDIDNVETMIGKSLSTSDELKTLHRLCYGNPGQKTVVKKNLRAFCGFDDTADVDKKKESIRKKDLVAVKKMLAVCDQQLSGTKEDCLTRLLDFLKKPTASGKKSIKEAATAKRKRSTAKKTTATKKKAKKGAGKAAGGPKRPLSAFLLYCNNKRDKVRAENPDASMVDVTRILAEKWKGISDERRTKYNAEAADLKAKYEKEKSAFEAKSKGSAAKPSPAKSKKDDSEDEDDDEEEGPEEEGPEEEGPEEEGPEEEGPEEEEDGGDDGDDDEPEDAPSDEPDDAPPDVTAEEAAKDE